MASRRSSASISPRFELLAASCKMRSFSAALNTRRARLGLSDDAGLGSDSRVRAKPLNAESSKARSAPGFCCEEWLIFIGPARLGWRDPSHGGENPRQRPCNARLRRFDHSAFIWLSRASRYAWIILPGSDESIGRGRPPRTAEPKKERAAPRNSRSAEPKKERAAPRNSRARLSSPRQSAKTLAHPAAQ